MIEKEFLIFLSAIEENPDISIKELTEQLGLPQTTTYERFTKFKNEFIKNKSVKFNNKKIGIHSEYLILCRINNENFTSDNKLIEEIKTLNNIITYQKCLVQNFDLILKAIFFSLEEIEEFKKKLSKSILIKSFEFILTFEEQNIKKTSDVISNYFEKLKN